MVRNSSLLSIVLLAIVWKTLLTPTPAMSQAETIVVIDAWVTAGDNTSRTILLFGSPIRYYALIDNQTGITQKIQTFWVVEGPCGLILDEILFIETPSGLVEWVFIDTLSSDVCAGDYQLVVTASYEGEASKFESSFEVRGGNLFLPLLVR